MLASGGEALTLAQAQDEARAKAPEGALFSARLKAAEELAIDARRAVRRDPSINFNVAPGELGGDTSERDIGVGLVVGGCDGLVGASSCVGCGRPRPLQI